MSRVTLEDLIVGRNGLDALLRTDTDDAEAPAWQATIDFLNREIVRRGAWASVRPDRSTYTDRELAVLYYDQEQNLAPADWLLIETEIIARKHQRESGDGL